MKEGILSRAGFAKAWFVFLKEINSFFGSSLPPITLGVVAFLCGLLDAVLISPGATYEDVTRILYYMFYIIIIVAGLFLSMGSFVNERKQGTLELLYTLPVSDVELVMGKFFMGVMLVGSAALSMVLIYIVLISEAPWYMAGSGFVGLLLVGLYAYSAGIFASTLSDSYLISLLVGALIIGIIDIGGFMAGLLPSPAKGIFSHLHGLNQFTPFSRGVIPLKGSVFFLSLTVFFLFLSVKVLESRRWRG